MLKPIYTVPILFLTFALAACGQAAAPTPASATVTGSVTKLDRRALPPDAVVEVQLQDTSRQDVAAEVLSTFTIFLEGGQLPVDYELTYDPAAIQANHTYTVRARITDGSGSLLYTSTTVIPVITNGAPTENVEILVDPV